MKTEHWYNSYKWWWSRIGGRPWTFVMRDYYHNAPVIVLIVILALGAVLGNFFGFLFVLKVLGVVLIGVIIGHLFWGTPWIPNQPGSIANGGITFGKVDK